MEPGLAFLSTLSLRRATVRKGTAGRINSNFYPRSPCGERPALPGKAVTTREFLSTLSLRRATHIHAPSHNLCLHFYPRSPCGERLASAGRLQIINYFYPRSPCGERRGCVVGSWPRGIFLSTLSLRRATALRQLQSALR